MKNWMITTTLIIILFLLAVNLNWRVKDKFLQLKYDLIHTNQQVNTKVEIDKILSTIKKIDFDDLDSDYLSYTKSTQPRYKKMLKQLKYLKVQRTDLNKKIVGHFRLKEFICKDDFYQDCIMSSGTEITCILNPKIFYKTLALLNELEKGNYNKDGFRIVNGHRHPGYNEKIGGAKLSRHIKGEAVDIVIDDINNDGYADKMDKDIVLDLLEHKIIKDEGGIGLYPGTDNVHYDVRGTRARWNSY